MSEIARCPVCGENPAINTADSYGLVGVVCCGVSIWDKDNPRRWNQYVAAMRLAEAEDWVEEVTDLWAENTDEHNVSEIFDAALNEVMFAIKAWREVK